MSNNKKITWKQVENLITKNLHKIKNVENIYGIPRGGLIPAVMISHLTGLKLTSKITKKTLIVDEICDTGQTFIELEKELGFKPKTFVLHKKNIAKYEPTISCQNIRTKKWIIYPWEKNKIKK